MTNYYDPWSHAMEIVAMRAAQFCALSLILGGLAWYGVLRVYFEMPVIETTKTMLTSDLPALRMICMQCFINGSLTTFSLFVWLMRGRSLTGGERHHRGARVIHRYHRDDE